MSYASTDKVFYCRECGEINDICAYSSSVSEWGTVSLGRYGLDYESRDSETNDTWHKCENCDEEFRDFGEAQMTYEHALSLKMADRGYEDMSEDEQSDYDDIFGEPEPVEPREGRNTLKCPEEVSSDT